jgi:hypothetical protein
MDKIISPRGDLHPIQQIPMAQRLYSFEGKTIYVVDVRWPYTHQFMEEMVHIFSTRYPETHFELREKAGAYGENDPNLWSEIQENADAVIMAVGH